jgi:hypothetical protein
MPNVGARNTGPSTTENLEERLRALIASKVWNTEYDQNREDLVRSSRTPLRYSRAKTEERAKVFGQVFLNQPDTSPEEWAAQDKGMPGAFGGYRYSEDS